MTMKTELTAVWDKMEPDAVSCDRMLSKVLAYNELVHHNPKTRSRTKKAGIRIAVCAACICLAAAAAFPILRHAGTAAVSPSPSADKTHASELAEPGETHPQADTSAGLTPALEENASAGFPTGEDTIGVQNGIDQPTQSYAQSPDSEPEISVPAVSSEPEPNDKPPYDSDQSSYLPSQGPDTPNPPPLGKEMISSYGVMPELPDPDLAVRNGSAVLSVPLQNAMSAYGDTVRYRVIVEFFQDGVQIDSRGAAAEKETDRLSSEGYTVALETFWDGIQETVWFTLHAEYDQLISFSPSPDLGYLILLYDERTGASSVPDSGIAFNGIVYDVE